MPTLRLYASTSLFLCFVVFGRTCELVKKVRLPPRLESLPSRRGDLQGNASMIYINGRVNSSQDLGIYVLCESFIL
ncbi:hypothetical protein Desac_2652 [Desulfobacca acetoxidans DSM 11109]|uniref:Uncharacterized protein n=1 Tax=Desulfobacca acetoxidans (strain ATCC 700848 / DSM 11109 / ASRB2) TaxID=880072 RepID=F2NIJ2_DESAR|nr:hypothetical protein Desac_2652 [Desulfobacca acetoxidans DSM 11109]